MRFRHELIFSAIAVFVVEAGSKLNPYRAGLKLTSFSVFSSAPLLLGLPAATILPNLSEVGHVTIQLALLIHPVHATVYVLVLTVVMCPHF